MGARKLVTTLAVSAALAIHVAATGVCPTYTPSVHMPRGTNVPVIVSDEDVKPKKQWEPDESDIVALAKTLYGECRGCSELQQRAVCWAVLNRVDDPRFPDTVIGVVSAKSQLQGYSPNNPVWDSLYQVADSVLRDWHDGVNRVFGPEMVYFHGNGRINLFRSVYDGPDEWWEE